MNIYQIALLCPFCDAENILGTVDACDALEAKHKAAILWPDARYEEMVARIQHQGLEPSRSEAERGFNDAGFRSVERVAKAS